MSSQVKAGAKFRVFRGQSSSNVKIKTGINSHAPVFHIQSYWWVWFFWHWNANIRTHEHFFWGLWSQNLIANICTRENFPLYGIILFCQLYIHTHTYNYALSRTLFHTLLFSLAAFPPIAPAVPESALPIGMEQEDGSTQLIPVEASKLMKWSYACISL